MKAAYNLELGTQWRLNDAEVSFSGPPHYCVANFDIENISEKKLRVRYFKVLFQPDHCATPQAALKLNQSQILLQSVIAPQSLQTVEGRLDISAETPPGHYQLQVLIGDRELKANVEVLEHTMLRIQPRRVHLEGCPGETLTHTLNFNNLGNTDIQLPGCSMVWFEERDWVGHNLVQAIRTSNEEDQYEDFLNALLKRMKKSLVPSITVNFNDLSGESCDRVLSPKTSLSRQLSLVLPKGLQKGKVYHGFVKIHQFRFWLALYCTQHKEGKHTKLDETSSVT